MASESDESTGTLPAGPAGVPPRNYRYLALLAVSGAVFLSLLSYDDRDSAYLAGGLTEDLFIHNWMGYVGARTARFLLLTLGLCGYVVVPLLMAAALRRFAGGPRVRPARWDYWAALVLTTLGLCMLLGSWPDFLGDVATDLNIAMLTGGVIGQRLCDPQLGWMQIVLNPAGNALVGLVLLLVGLAVVYVYDWHGFVRFLLTRPEAAGAGTSPLVDTLGTRSNRFLERLAKRRQTRTQPAAGTGAAADTPLLPLRKPEPPVEPPPRQDPPKGTPPLARSETKPAPPAALPAPASRAEPVPAKPRPATPDKPPRKSAAKAYALPPMDLLNRHDDRETAVEPAEVEEKKQILQAVLDSFGIEAKVGDATCGPRVTLFEVLPAPGVKVERISQISNNIAMELRAVSLRVLTPIPGRNSVGIEVPNAKSATVSLRGLMLTPAWKNTQARIPLLIGRNISGGVVVLDLAKAPHLLIAGATGSGKSVCINALIMSMLCRFRPEELRLIMVDPKVVEFRAYETLPHLIVPVISDVKKVPLALRWIITEMERRYKMFAKVGARNIEGFNDRPATPAPALDDDGKPIPERVPYIVLIIDELADIMMTAKADVETGLTRIAQLSRAVGIHAIVATQRPSVNVITGTIKANFPTRIAFQVTSQIDSRTILDGKGAEALLGRGDMLFKPPGASKIERNQSAFVEDEEIERIVAHCASQAEQEFEADVFKAPAEPGAGGAAGEEALEADEELIQQAVDIIVRDRRPTTSYVQRCLRIGYNRAALIMEILEKRGVIGPQVGTAPREILIAGPAGAGSTAPLPPAAEADGEEGDAPSAERDLDLDEPDRPDEKP